MPGTFVFRSIGLHTHVLAFAKVIARLARAQLCDDFGSLLLSFFFRSDVLEAVVLANNLKHITMILKFIDHGLAIR